ncbi:hypothetical protein OKW22_000848 [Bacilli bacterium PM5-3]|nr:hypothetical protein [Bacilli bacterium PM5-3]MDH6603599.1 hypothetical protein [Bacilli bacterium PM5-9]
MKKYINGLQKANLDDVLESVITAFPYSSLEGKSEKSESRVDYLLNLINRTIETK